jgi:thiamine pyrophosphokinase
MEWDPSRFFGASGSPSPYALLILNQPINEKAFGVLSKYGKFHDESVQIISVF